MQLDITLHYDNINCTQAKKREQNMWEYYIFYNINNILETFWTPELAFKLPPWAEKYIRAEVLT